MNLTSLAYELVSPILDFIYPPLCLVCHTLMPDARQKICTDCWKTIPRVTTDDPLYQQTREKLLAEGTITELVSCYVFEKSGHFQNIAHALKYKEYQSLGADLGIRIGEVLQARGIEIDVLIPVPLHRIKQRERGYNQSECIAHGIASVIDKPVLLKTVRRTRNTQTQTKLTSEERQANMSHAFELLPSASHLLFNNKCLLIDDVITTGATIKACARALQKGNTATIIAASAALAR